jgi:rhodanese-related sulfurtransferase
MPQDIQRAEVQRLVQGGAQLLDVLPRADFEEFHLPGAINLPLAHIRRDSMGDLQKQKPTVTYCYDTQ